MKKIIVFASGSGSNAENIIQYFEKTEMAKVVLVLTNNAAAKVIQRAENHNIPVEIFTKNDLNEGKVLQMLNKLSPDLIVLAGFLLQFPKSIIEVYPTSIVNIHPALLPNYGGKGMYGMHIHNAVVENKEKETGITIHYVNENYDEGTIIFQQKVALEDNDTAATIAAKIHVLEQQYFPAVLAKVLEGESFI